MAQTEFLVHGQSVSADNVAISYQNGNNSETIRFHKGSQLIFGNEEYHEHLSLSDEAYNAFMEIVGSDKELTFSDLARIDQVARKYNIKLDKSKMDNEHKVVLQFDTCETLSLDFETEKESKELDEIVEAFTVPQDLVSKFFRSGYEQFQKAKPTIKEGLYKIIDNRITRKIIDQVCNAVDRICDWQERP